MTIRSSRNSAELLQSAANDFVMLAGELLSTKPKIRVLLTGGSLGIAFLAALADKKLEWDRVWLMFSDERFVPLEHQDRNEHQGITAWPELANLLNRFPATDIELEAAAAETTAALGAELGPLGAGTACFDLTVLGMGPDAHIASLFPGHTQADSWVIAESNSPKPPAGRLSLSYQALNRSERVWFLAAGESKSWAVAQSLDPASGLPAGRVRGRSETVWYLDQEITDAL
jgi:6-phosphogluconolactonase